MAREQSPETTTIHSENKQRQRIYTKKISVLVGFSIFYLRGGPSAAQCWMPRTLIDFNGLSGVKMREQSAGNHRSW